MVSPMKRSVANVTARVCAWAGLSMALAIGVLWGPQALAQAWPAKPVKIIVPYPPGSTMDGFSRVIAQKLSEMWKVGVVVEIIAGAGGVVGTQAVAKAAPDGYTLGWIGSPHAINAALFPNLPFDPIKDFRAVVCFAATPLVFVAKPTLAANTISELIAMAKASPGKLNYASNGNGSYSHLTTELLASRTGTTFTHVPYKNTGQLIADLIGGQVDFAALGVSVSVSHIQSGKMKALGVTSSRRQSTLPNVPAVGETLPGYEAMSWIGIVTPAGAPDAVVAKVEADVLTAMKDPGVLAAVAKQALDIDLLDSAQFARRIENDLRVWKKIVSDAGIKAE